MIAMSPGKEVPGSSPGWVDILFIFTLSPLGTKSQKCKKTEFPTKIGVSIYKQWWSSLRGRAGAVIATVHSTRAGSDAEHSSFPTAIPA